MMFEIGVADAYGACFEGADRGFVNRNNDLHYETHPRKLRKRPEDYNPSLVPKGGYTDDTQMSIAVAEAVLEDGPWEEESLADRFVEAFRRDPRRGYTPYWYGLRSAPGPGTTALGHSRRCQHSDQHSGSLEDRDRRPRGVLPRVNFCRNHAHGRLAGRGCYRMAWVAAG